MRKELLGKMDLTGKVAVVTGGSSGIGRASAITLADAGAEVVVVNRNKEKGEAVVKDIESRGGKGYHFTADVSKVDEIDEMVKDVIDNYGKIDILVNSAGVNVRDNIEDVREEDYDKILDINLKGVFFCCQRVGRVMIEQGNGGKIVNIGSLQAEEVLPLRGAYTASKGGVKHVSQAFAVEWAKYNINVNVINPAFVRTAMVEKVLEDKIWHDVIIGNTPLKRVCEPEEVADTVLFLVSDMSTYITGQSIVVDGGWTAGDAVEGI